MFTAEQFYNSLLVMYAFGFILGASSAFVKNRLSGREVKT